MHQPIQQVVAVTGFHESGLQTVASLLLGSGYLLKYPGQDLDVAVFDAEGQVLFDDYLENIEILRLNSEMLRAAGLTWDNMPEITQIPMLDVRPFVGMFEGQNCAIVDPRLCWTLPAYNRTITHLVFVECDDPGSVCRLMTEKYGDDVEYWQRQLRRYESNFRSFNAGHLRLKSSQLSDTRAVASQLATFLSH